MVRSLGERLKAAREKKKYTQLEASRFLGISNGTLSGYERNYRDPDTVTLAKLAALYDVDANYLINGTHPVIREKIEEYSIEPERRILIDMIKKVPEEELQDLEILLRKFIKIN